MTCWILTHGEIQEFMGEDLVQDQIFVAVFEQKPTIVQLQELFKDVKSDCVTHQDFFLHLLRGGGRRRYLILPPGVGIRAVIRVLGAGEPYKERSYEERQNEIYFHADTAWYNLTEIAENKYYDSWL
jgi:hypothetical protein